MSLPRRAERSLAADGAIACFGAKPQLAPRSTNMVRDMELVRKIMLKMESGELSGGVDGYTDDAVNYHKALLVERGLVEGSPLYATGKNSSPNIPTNVFIKKLTWE